MEQLVDGHIERLGKLQRQQRRRGEHAILDRVHGLAGDPDFLGKLRLRQAEFAARFLQIIGELLSQKISPAARAFRSGPAPPRCRPRR